MSRHNVGLDKVSGQDHAIMEQVNKIFMEKKINLFTYRTGHPCKVNRIRFHARLTSL
jgi:hypothetical protein